MAHVHGPLLVFAGAGSGKTRVITYRIANLVAASACRRTASSPSPSRTRPPARCARASTSSLGADVGRARPLGRHVPRDLRASSCAASARRGRASRRTSSSTTRTDQKRRRHARPEGARPRREALPAARGARPHPQGEAGGARARRDEPATRTSTTASRRSTRSTRSTLRAANAVDFEDLILPRRAHPRGSRSSTDATRASAARVRARPRRRVPGHERDAVPASCARSPRDTQNLCVVGDDDQSIYRWRGADVRNIRGFRATSRTRGREARAELPLDGRIVARRARRHRAVARARAEGALDRRTRTGSPIDVVAARRRARRGGARRAAASARRATRASTAARSPSSTASTRSRACSKRRSASANMPYQIVGGMKFYERAEVKDALAYLRVLVNPQSDVDFLRIVNVPARGIGQTTHRPAHGVRHDARSTPVLLRARRDRRGARTCAAAAKKKPRSRCASCSRTLQAQSQRRRRRARCCSRCVLDKTGYKRRARRRRTAPSRRAPREPGGARRLDARLRGGGAGRRRERRRSTASSSASRSQSDVDPMEDDGRSR